MITRILSYLTFGMLITSVALYTLSLKGSSTSRSVLLSTPKTIELGRVEQGQKVTFAFRVENTTTSPVTVVELYPSCGCTTLDDMKLKRIENGKALSIRGTLDTEGKRGRTESHVVLTYKTDSKGPERNVILTVRANVRPMIRVTPEPIVFTLDPTSQDKVSKVVELDSERLELFSIDDVRSSTSFITVEVLNRKFRKDGASIKPAKLKVTIDPVGLEAVSGYGHSANPLLRVQTTVESDSVFSIPIEIRKH